MRFFRLLLNRAFIRSELDKETNALILLKELVQNLKRKNINIDMSNYSVLIPFNLPNTFEIYLGEELEEEDEELVAALQEGSFLTFNDRKTVVKKFQKFDLIFNPRVLKGYSGQRVNVYKTVNPIVYQELIDNTPYSDNKKTIVDTEAARLIVNRCIKKELNRRYSIAMDEVEIAWKNFGVSFVKVDLKEKRQIAAYGMFAINCQLAFFLGDYIQSGLGKLFINNPDKEKNSKFKDIKIVMPTQIIEDVFNGVANKSFLNSLVHEHIVKKIEESSIDENKKKSYIEELLKSNKMEMTND